MTTPLDIMLSCKHCDEQVPPYDTADRNYKAWQCPHCKGWNNWMKYTVEPNEVINYQPANQSIPDDLVKRWADEVEAITQQGNISEMGKAILAQAKALGIKVIEVDPKDLMGYLTSPSNSRYNVADMRGNPVPDDVVAGNLPPWHEDNKGRWDLRDKDGDYHSPAYYLEGFMSAHREYLKLHSSFPQGATEEQEDAHMRKLDDALEECDEFDNYVNKLFGK